MAAIAGRLSVADGGIEDVRASLTRIENILGVLDQRMLGFDQRLQGVEGRLEGVERRLEGVERRLDGVDHRLHGVERQLERLDQKIINLDEKVTGLTKRMDYTENRFDRLFLWVIGIQMTTLIAIVAGLFGIVTKLIPNS